MTDSLGVDEAVEYVARAIANEVLHAGLDWDNDLDDDDRDHARRAARSVLTAATAPRPCPTCGGEEDEVGTPCPDCDGTGVLDSLAVLRSDIERLGLVSEWGGGIVRVLVDRGLQEYPPFRERVFILRTSRAVPELGETE